MNIDTIVVKGKEYLVGKVITYVDIFSRLDYNKRYYISVPKLIQLLESKGINLDTETITVAIDRRNGFSGLLMITTESAGYFEFLYNEYQDILTREGTIKQQLLNAAETIKNVVYVPSGVVNQYGVYGATYQPYSTETVCLDIFYYADPYSSQNANIISCSIDDLISIFEEFEEE